MSQPTSPRLLSLDVLRAVAVLLVLGRHLWNPENCHSEWLRPIFHAWNRGGWVGVDLFFVLSGYLVSGLLFQAYRRNRELNIGRFLIRRGFKIYPGFWLLLGTTLVIAPLAKFPVLTTSQVISETFFLQSYFKGAWNHSWSLAVEEHFYLLLPLLLASLVWLRKGSDDPFQPLVPGFVVAAAAMLGLRIYTALTQSFEYSTHMFPTHLRLDSLLMGTTLAYLHHFHAERFESFFRKWGHLLMLIGPAVFAPAFLMPMETSPFIYTAGFTLFYVGGALIVGSFVVQGVRPSTLSRVLAFLGQNSFSIYLWHMPVRIWVIPWLLKTLAWKPNYLSAVALYVGLSLLIGCVLARLVEMPMLKVRDYFFPADTTKQKSLSTTIAKTNPVLQPISS